MSHFIEACWYIQHGPYYYGKLDSKSPVNLLTGLLICCEHAVLCSIISPLAWCSNNKRATDNKPFESQMINHNRKRQYNSAQSH